MVIVCPAPRASQTLLQQAAQQAAPLPPSATPSAADNAEAHRQAQTPSAVNKAEACRDQLCVVHQALANLPETSAMGGQRHELAHTIAELEQDLEHLKSAAPASPIQLQAKQDAREGRLIKKRQHNVDGGRRRKVARRTNRKYEQVSGGGVRVDTRCSPPVQHCAWGWGKGSGFRLNPTPTIFCRSVLSLQVAMPVKLTDATMFCGMTASTEAAAKLATRAHAEKLNKLIRQPKNGGGGSGYVAYCCAGAGCKYKVTWNFKKASTSNDFSADDDDVAASAASSPIREPNRRCWEVTNYEQHDCDYSPVVAARKKSCNLTPANLVPVIRDLIEANPDIPASDLQSAIKPYLHDLWNAKQLQRLKDAGKKAAGFSASKTDDIAQIANVVKTLRSMGHYADFWTVDATKMRSVTVKAAKLSWDRIENLRSKKQKTYIKVAFDAAKFQLGEEYTSIVDGRAYFGGYTYAPPYMVECDDAEPGSDNEDEQRVEGDAYFFEGIPIEERYGPVSQTDMAHAKNGVPGNFAYRTLMGPNNEIKTMLAGCVVGNESYEAYEPFDKTTVTLYGEHYDNDKSINVADGDKGSRQSFAAHFKKALMFHCKWHMGQNVVKYGSGKDRSAYERCMRARSTDELNAAVDAIPGDKGKAYIEKFDRKAVFPQAAADAGYKLCGSSSSTCAESMNATTINNRGKPPSASLLGIAQHCHKKWHGDRDKALKCTSTLPPKVEKNLKAVKERALAVTHIEAVGVGSGMYKVPSTAEGNCSIHLVTHSQANLTISCNCGRERVLDKHMCHHSAAVLMKLKRPLAAYVSKIYTTAHWQQLHAQTYEVPMSVEECSDMGPALTPQQMSLPVAAIPPRGRPSRKRDRMALADGVKSTVRCGNCQKIGHNSRTCKGPSEANHEGHA